MNSFGDLRAHEMAMIAGMRAALAGLLQRFAPDNLERRLKKGSAFSLPIPGAAKSRLWDAFVAMHRHLHSPRRSGREGGFHNAAR
ncbi:MAG: hypothetical protein IPG06_22890 [Haliea sp.]|nr:hypothetical protein [Haliea sp.]